MVTLKALVLAAAFLVSNAHPQEPLPYRNTIFGDEQLEGGPFEFVNSLNDIVSRNVDNNPYRLPRTVIPNHYTLGLIVNMTDLTFSGEVVIDLEATQANVNEIILHAHDMEINSVDLETDNRTVYATHTLQPEYHFLRVRLTSEHLGYNSSSLTQTVYHLKIAFQSSLRSDMTGLYRNWYRNDSLDTDVRWMASTHFQATAARFAFPCFDEPSFKATFDVTITRPNNFDSWFCTRRSNYTDSEITGYVNDVYSRTPVMSTYLLAIIVTQYDNKTIDTEDGLLKYEVIAREGAMLDNQGDYAFNLGQALLEEMSNHTGMDFYSLSPNIKMTHASIPDFSAGAMENWGLLVYREAYLMYSQNHTSTYFKQLIAYILSHEIAHMWFGNLVTCDWWDNLWLNEGFARYYQYFLTDWVDEELGLGDRFIPEQVHTALLTDSANNPHPLTNPGLGSPVEVRTMFTLISYNKGAAVIRMTEHLMGFENHREGLRRYLRDRAYKTALPIHLFQALQDAAVETGAIAGYSNFNIIDYYKTWSEQAGHPVLNVHVNHQTNEMTIYQRRFNINSGYSTSNTNWIIPITYATQSNPDFNNTKPSHIIREAVTVITRSGDFGDQWVIFNKQQTGFYRVNYDDYTWDLIAMALKGPNRTIINEYNRAQIVDDVFQFARSGIISYARAFNILSFLREETEYTPWIAAINGFNWISNRVVGTPLEEPLRNLIIEWATPLMNQLHYEPVEGERLMRSYLRYQLAPVMCRLGVQECRDAAWSQYQALRGGNEVPVDSRNWVYCNALRNGTLEDFEYFYDRFLYHNVYNEKIQLLMVLGCTSIPEALNRFLDDIVQENNIIRPQDYTTAFNSAATGNEENTQILFEYIKNNLENCTRAFNSVTTPLSYVSSRLRTPEEVEAFRTWATENQQDLGDSYLTVFNSAQTSLDALDWAAGIQADMGSYFQNGDEPLSTSTPAPTTTTTAATFTAPPIAAPVTPYLPDSANTSFLSIAVLALAILITFAL